MCNKNQTFSHRRAILRCATKDIEKFIVNLNSLYTCQIIFRESVNQFIKGIDAGFGGFFVYPNGNGG